MLAIVISLTEQRVHIRALNYTFHFDRAEPIHVEISKKYSLEEIEESTQKTHFQVKQNFTDQKKYFVDGLWVKI